MLRLTFLILLPCAAFAASLVDTKYGELLTGFKDGEVQYDGGNHNDGYWSCPWNLGGGGCANGDFACDCNDGSRIKFQIGCCYHFPKCGRMCHNWSCYRYRNCATCKNWVGEWDNNACSSCKRGFVYESGLCDKDLNECNNRNGGCDQNCHNNYGSYTCSCNSGYSLNSDGHTCKRLSCPAISDTTLTSVKASDNWLFASYATFTPKDPLLTMDGPSTVECQAKGTYTYWDQSRPVLVDTCNFVPGSSRVRCPGTAEDVSREACLQRGCCYHSMPDVPTCFLNPTMNYIKYGGTSPVSSEAEGIMSYKNHNVKTCTHKCHNSYHTSRCKSFGIKHKGDSQGVHLQDCKILDKSRSELAAAGKIISNPNYDMYESLVMPSKKAFNSDPSSGVTKQYEGCFKDDSSSPDLTFLVMTSTTHMTPEKCISVCRMESHKYAGLQNGKDCYCGSNSYRQYGEAVTPVTCNVPCTGDSSKTCGGTGVNAVYNVAWTDSYLGCYKDDANNHDLPVKIWDKDAGRSAGECMHECTKKNYAYAGLQNGGVCYCGNSYGSHGAVEEYQCTESCYGYARQNCGGTGVNAIYQTEIVNAVDSTIQPAVTRLYDTSGSLTGISTMMFTFYPGLKTVLSKRLIIHTTNDVLTPSEATCSTDCYTPCGDIHHDERISNKGADVNLRFFYLNLSDLHKYVGTAAKRVFVHVQTLLVDQDIKADYALYIRAKKIILDRSQAYYIEVPSTAEEFDINVEAEKFYDPESDTLHQKQSMMCARILLNTQQRNYINSGYSILYDIATTSSRINENKALSATARNIIAELAGLERDDVRFVPFYTKTHLARLLDNYYEMIGLYSQKLGKLVEGNHQKEQVVEYVEGMHSIYTDTDIYESKTAFDASVLAVKRSNATYQRFRQDYEASRDNLEDAKLVFEEGLEEKKGWEIAKFLIKVIASVAKTVVGAYDKNKDKPDEPAEIEIDIDELFGLMQELSETIAQIDELSAVADQVVAAIEEMETEFDGIRYYDEVEMSVQLQVNIVKWKNLKNYGETLLTRDDVAAIRGCSDYHRHLLDVCNWGEALTRSMVERAEMLRDSMEKRSVLDLKYEQKDRIDDHLQKYKDDLYAQELIISEMVEQSYDVRLDLNEALLTFCQAYFYENMFECKPSYKPSFGGSLDDLLLKINDAKRDDLLVGVAPSTIHRYIDITDTDTDPLCNDALTCPINYLRKNRILYFTLPTDHKDLRDIDAYKVSELIIKFNGAAPSVDNKYLKIQIESSGDFLGRANNQVHHFLTRALSLAFEYDITTDHITVRADVYKEFNNIIQHITPFTTWVMRVSDLRSSDIDLSNVTSVRIQYNGSGVDNETWKARQQAALGQ